MESCIEAIHTQRSASLSRRVKGTFLCSVSLLVLGDTMFMSESLTSACVIYRWKERTVSISLKFLVRPWDNRAVHDKRNSWLANNTVISFTYQFYILIERSVKLLFPILLVWINAVMTNCFSTNWEDNILWNEQYCFKFVGISKYIHHIIITAHFKKQNIFHLSVFYQYQDIILKLAHVNPISLH